MNNININFIVTPYENETITSRALENGFDDTSVYLKVVALKIQKFILAYPDSSGAEASVELGFKVTGSQKMRIEENMKECDCEDMSVYLKHVAMHGVVSAVVEVRSTGTLDAMLQRIADSRKG